MPTFLISPVVEPEWAEDPSAFGSSLRERWPEAQIREMPDDSTMVLAFEVAGASGALDREGNALIIEGDLEVAAEVAAWWRTRVPAGVPLVFYDEAYAADVPVDPGARAHAIAAAYAAADKS